MRPRSFWIGPADDDELLAVQSFGFAPKAAVPSAYKARRSSWRASEMSSPSPVSWPLNWKARLALRSTAQSSALRSMRAGDPRRPGRQGARGRRRSRPAAPCARHRSPLGCSRSSATERRRRQAEFAVDIRSLRLHIGKRRDGAWIFVAPVQPVRVSSWTRPWPKRAAIR